MSGPYDLSGVQEKVMYEPYTYSSYLPYLLLSLNTAYQLFDEESFYKIFKPPLRFCGKTHVQWRL